MLSHELSEKIVSELKDIFRNDLCSIVLYGSYAKERAQKYSDIDILIILNRKFANWIERRDLEIELRKRLYHTVGQVSPKVCAIEELEAALASFYILILDILDSGIVLYDDGCFVELKDQFKKIVPSKVLRHADYWEVVA